MPEEEYDFVDLTLGFSSFYQASLTKLPFLGSKLQGKDSFNSFPVPKLRTDDKSSSKQHKHGEFVDHHLYCSFALKLSDSLPFSHMDFLESSTFSKVIFRRPSQILSPDFELKGMPLYSSDVTCFLGESSS